MQNPFLIGEKVYLRPLERTDAPQLTTWINNRDVNRFLKVYRPMNLQNEEEFIDATRKSKTDVVFGVSTKDGNHLIGCTGLHDIDQVNRNCHFGIMIGEPSSWGKGFGTEATRLITRYAFESLNLHRVWLTVYDFNLRGAAVYEKVGYKREGVLRQHTYREGKYHDAIMMGITRPDWDEINSGTKKLVPVF